MYAERSVGSRQRITVPDALYRVARRAERDLDVGGAVRGGLLAGAVPRVLVSTDRIRELPISCREAFVLSLVDGASSVETLFDISGLSEEETAAILDKLVALGAVGIDAQGRRTR